MNAQYTRENYLELFNALFQTISLPCEQNDDDSGVEEVYTDTSTEHGVDSPWGFDGEDDESPSSVSIHRNGNAESRPCGRAKPSRNTEPGVTSEAAYSVCVEGLSSS